MKNNFISFSKARLTDFYQATINLFMFFPYFFSIPSLTKSLFSPWKNLVSKEKTVGFSLDVWLSTFSFNVISSVMGFIMRSSIILFYFIFQAVLLLFLPFIFTMAKDRIQMPSGMGGLVRYFDEYKSNIEFKPGHIILLCIIVIIIMIFLYSFGAGILGIR